MVKPGEAYEKLDCFQAVSLPSNAFCIPLHLLLGLKTNLQLRFQYLKACCCTAELSGDLS